MADEVKNGLSAYIASKWDRNTVADGSWLQKYTLSPLTARDYYLASAIDELYNNTGDKSSELSAAISSVSSIHDEYINYLSATISGDISGHIEYVSGSVDDLRDDLQTSANTLLQKIDDETGRAEAAETKINTRLNNMEAATDVINVYGSWDDFSNNSGELFTVSGITDNDIIKILNDKNEYPNEMFQHTQQISSGHQTYFRWINSAIPETAHIKPLDPASGYWDFIGYVDPYYTTTEIDEYLDHINGDFDSLSATVANNYLSANKNAVSAGKNILIDYDENNPKISINTKEDVEFTTVSSNGFSGKNLSGASKNDSIDNLFGSAYSGAAASAWVSANSAHLDIQAGYGLETGEDEGHLVIGLHQDHCDYYGHSLALGSWSTANGDNSYAFGMSCVTIGGAALAIGDNAYATTGAVALGTYNSAMGKYSLALGYNSTAFNQFSIAIGRGLSGEAPITLGTWNDNVAGATFIIGDGTGTQEGHDVIRKNALVIKDGLVSGRDFSAGNVSLSSLTNLSAFGNGITNTATFNLSAVKLSAGQGIGFKNDTNGVLSITAEGTTYQDGDYISTANKTIAVTGDLITSAEAGSAASAWINSKNSTIAFTTNFNGLNNVITGYGTSSFSAGESYIDGNYIHIDTSNNSINLASSISSTNISANSSFLSTASGISAKFDNISGKNVSSINITANSLSGNNTKFTDISATNITGVYLSSTNISAKNISGLDNINADSGYFNYLRGETLQGVTSSIDVDELISAVSSITGESNIYVRKDELECEIGSANTAIKQAFAQGKSNSANENSFVQGDSNTAGHGSFAQGQSNSANSKAFAQGYSNTAYYESFAQGQINRVSNYSMGQGQGNSATNCSIAQGLHNNASNSAQAFGSNLIIESAMAIGKFNKTSSDAVFVIGNGTADNARNDLMVVDNSAAITLINYPYNDNQVDKIIISTTGVSGMYDHTRGGIELTGEYSSEWSNICNIENKYVPLSAIKCDIGSNNSASDDELVFMQGMHNYASNNSLTQGSDNSAIYYSLAQGYRNLASSNSIAVGTNNTAYNNSQSFGQEAYASAGGMAINPHYWGSTSPTKAINNSFAMGKECVASSDSLAFGQNNTASGWSISFGQNNTASNFSVAFGLGISANDNQYIYGKYPIVGATTVFAIGNGSDDNNRRNYVSINKYGTLNLKNTVNNVNKSVIINGHDRYIRSEENCRNIPFLLTSGYALTSTITGSLLSTPKINTETLLLYGNDSDYLNMWVPTGTSGNKFKIMKVASMGTYKISVGIQAGYDMIFKNFSSGTTLASRKKIQTDNTNTSWPTPQQGTNISTSAKSFYFSAEANTTCVQFTEIPGHDDIDVIVDALGKHFIMIKNHSEV